MTLIIVAVVLLGYFLIATEKLSGINRAAVAVFIGTVGWVLYICYGSNYVMSQHPGDYVSFLDGMVATSTAAKEYIARSVFVAWVGRAAEILLFLLTTMTIVEIMQNNGCFDFVSKILRTRNSQRILWTLVIITFLLSANIDNLTTTVLMLGIMHSLVSQHRQRVIIGSAIVVAANCGGVLTVIGDASGLYLWNYSLITPTEYSLSLAIPCLVATVVPVWWIGRKLPERVETERWVMPYRGDDTNMAGWKKFVICLFGIGGLWFIPTFHDMTKLSPFLGAMCVLSLLWIVNEIFNRKLMNMDFISMRRTPVTVQYGGVQSILFVCGIMLAVGVLEETGAMEQAAVLLSPYINNIWCIGFFAGLVSTALDNFAVAVTMFSLDGIESLAPDYVENGAYWRVISFTSAMGGNVLAIGSVSGLAFLKMERVSAGWFFTNVGWKAMIGALLGMVALYFTV